MAHEARYLAEQFGNSDVSVFDQKDVEFSSIAERLSHSAYIHATTHGIHSWADPSAAGIEVQEDFFLSLKLLEIGTIELKACHLAYLSACSSW